ncbi:MAG: hypothetical protein QOJ34_667 [Pseudonocardiales bacterium]|nr:hypothetical protein [Pseudonocardiales bacterium]
MQTVLVFVAIPLGVVLLVALAVYGKSLVRQPNRYRPGKPWTYPASWYVPHPDAVVAHPAAGATTTAVGGASGEW